LPTDGTKIGYIVVSADSAVGANWFAAVTSSVKAICLVPFEVPTKNLPTDDDHAIVPLLVDAPTDGLNEAYDKSIWPSNGWNQILEIKPPVTPP